MVEEGWTDFDRMSHAHAVDFAEDIVGQIVLKIESEVPFKFALSADNAE